MCSQFDWAGLTHAIIQVRDRSPDTREEQRRGENEGGGKRKGRGKGGGGM